MGLELSTPGAYTTNNKVQALHVTKFDHTFIDPISICEKNNKQGWKI